jgi:peptidoglycan/LPS O-acetylase OafA/YrhL
MKRFLAVLILFAMASLVAIPLAAQVATSPPVDFGISDAFPGFVIAVAIAATSLFKRYAPSSFAARFIWLPSIIVGVIGALLLTNPITWRMVLWNAFSWAAGAAFIVLIVKRIGATDPPK